MNEINLLRQRGSEDRPSQKLARVLRLTSIVLFSIVGLSSAILFFLNFSSPLSSLQREEATLLSNLSAYQNRFNKYLIIQDRLKNISGVLSKRTKYNEKIDALLQKVPQDVFINSLSVDAKSMQISVSSHSLSAVNTLIDNTLELVADKKIKRLTMNSLSFDVGRGQYLLSLSADLL